MPTLYSKTSRGSGFDTIIFFPSAIGAAIRAIGHNKKVIVIQFMKGRKETIGEYKIRKKLPKYEIKQFGRKGWVNLKKPSLKDKLLAQEALDYAKLAAKKKPFLLMVPT